MYLLFVYGSHCRLSRSIIALCVFRFINNKIDEHSAGRYNPQI